MTKTLQLIRIALFILFLSLCHAVSHAQISVTSTTGYTVTINAYASAITPATNSCTYGYSYTVEVKYNISMTGTNVPSSLWALQGTVGCGSTASFFELPDNGGSGSTISATNYNSASNCATVTPGIMKCNTVTIEIEGPGISHRTVTFNSSTVPLDVKLTAFDALVDNNQVKLSWSTASENNNDFFTLERSVDGRQWDAVKNVKGAGTSTEVHNYQSYDESPLTGRSYYRLKQTDFDGHTSYSDIRSVNVTATNKTVSIYPVPNTGNTITITGMSDYKNHDLTVVNINGAVLYNTVLSKASTELPSLKPGLYIIRITDKLNGDMQSLRYVKL